MALLGWPRAGLVASGPIEALSDSSLWVVSTVLAPVRLGRGACRPASAAREGRAPPAPPPAAAADLPPLTPPRCRPAFLRLPSAWRTRWRSGWCPPGWTWPPETSPAAPTPSTSSGAREGLVASGGWCWWQLSCGAGAFLPLFRPRPVHTCRRGVGGCARAQPPRPALPPPCLPVTVHASQRSSIPPPIPAASRLTRRMCGTSAPPPRSPPSRARMWR